MLKRSKNTKSETDENILLGEGEEVVEGEEGTAAGQGEGNDVVAGLQALIAEKDKEIGELKDKYLRTLAESENARKRVRQQSEESVRLQRENLLRDLLPIIDNLERAVGAAQGGGNGQPIVQGVEMVLRSMFDLLKGHGVSQLDTVGQPFDPQKHEAVDHVASPNHRPNTVIKEFHRGYQIGDRTLRPARVSVAKGTAKSGGNGADNEPGDGEVENS
jgi:molecular chaperone GrpE